jgi:hypothetical protein
MPDFASQDVSLQKKVDVEQIEVGPEGQAQYVKKPTFGQKAKRHCLRWWWLHLIIFCTSFLIISLCL